MGDNTRHYTAVVIGSGFGGCMTGLTLAQALADRQKAETLLHRAP